MNWIDSGYMLTKAKQKIIIKSQWECTVDEKAADSMTETCVEKNKKMYLII